MANKKLSDLTAATTLAGADILLIENEAGNSRKITTANVRQSLGSVGAMATLSADATADYSTLTTISWDSETGGYDDAAFHSTSSNTSRLTLPDLTGTYGKKAARVSLECTVSMTGTTAADWMSLRINQNAGAAKGLPFERAEIGATTGGMTVIANNVPVTGDGSEYFEVQVQIESDASTTIASNRSSFKIWVTAWQ